MLSKSDRQRIQHMLDAIDKIAEALEGYSYNDFRLDWQKRLVIERLLEIIGEAANHITSTISLRKFKRKCKAWPRSMRAAGQMARPPGRACGGSRSS